MTDAKLVWYSNRGGKGAVFSTTWTIEGPSGSVFEITPQLEFGCAPGQSWAVVGGELKITFVGRQGNRYDIYTADIDGSNMESVTTGAVNAFYSTFGRVTGVSAREQGYYGPESSQEEELRVIFDSDHVGGRSQLFSIRLDGTGLLQLTGHPSDNEMPRWRRTSRIAERWTGLPIEELLLRHFGDAKHHRTFPKGVWRQGSRGSVATHRQHTRVDTPMPTYPEGADYVVERIHGGSIGRDLRCRGRRRCRVVVGHGVDDVAGTRSTSLTGGEAGYGLLAGGGTGALVGFASGDDQGGFISFTKEEKALGLGIVFGGLGAMIGGVAGALAPGDRWERVPPSWEVTTAPATAGRLALGASYRF